jgi:hypothetical protein
MLIFSAGKTIMADQTKYLLTGHCTICTLPFTTIIKWQNSQSDDGGRSTEEEE